MKLLRNPMAVGFLVLIALAMVVKTAVWPMLVRPPQRSGKQAAAVTPPLTTPITSAMKATDQARSLAEQISNTTAVADSALTAISTNSAVTRTLKTALAQLQTNATPGAELPRRDPFQIRHLPVSAAVTNVYYPSAMKLLTLSAIWRQTGGALAVINKRVFSEGDNIFRFTIQNIDADRVWVSGPNGREAVEFK